MLIPKRLIANEEKVSIIKENECLNCNLFRRTDLKQILTPGNEIGADIWSSRDIFGMSLNIYLCNTDEIGIESYQDDVNIVLKEKDNAKFIENSQHENYNFNQVEVEKLETLVVFMKIKSILAIEGAYPFAKGTENEKHYTYKMKVKYDPLVLNAFHYLIEVVSDESIDENGNWEKIRRNTAKKKYIRSLASEIRAKILQSRNIVFPLYPQN